MDRTADVNPARGDAATRGVAPTAIRAFGAESRLSGQILDARAIREAADAAAAEADPLSDLMGSANSRRDMVRVWVRYLLARFGYDGGTGPREQQ